MNNKKIKFKSAGISALSGVFAVATVSMPTTILAEDLIKSSEEANDYGFIYNKMGENRNRSIYVLKLREGLDATGKPFTPTKEQVKEASVVIAADGDVEKRYQVKYDGIYDLIAIQRAVGSFPQIEGSMHLTKDQGFEFPREDGYNITQSVDIKEEELIKELEVMLRAKTGEGLRGDFELYHLEEPESVYGKYFEDEDIFFDLEEAKELGYNRPKFKNNANKVMKNKSVETKDQKIAGFSIDKDSKIDWKIGEDKKEVIYAKNTGVEIREGFYMLKQTKFEDGYVDTNRSSEGVHYIRIGIDEKGKISVDSFLEYGVYKDGPEEESLFQKTVINELIPGLVPVFPEDPNKPWYGPGFDKIAEKTMEKNITEKAENVYIPDEVLDGHHIKVNVGEKFDLSFDIDVTNTYSFNFTDWLDDRIILPEGFSQQPYNFIEFYANGKKKDFEDSTKGYKISDEEGNKYVAMYCRPIGGGWVEKKDGEDVGEKEKVTLTIKLKDLTLKEGTREDVKNRAYVASDRGFVSTIDGLIDLDSANIIDVSNPGELLSKGKIDQSFIVGSPEITIDPITVDFRMGVVDQGTNILQNAKYEITKFIPSRGEGGINDDGNLYLEDVIFDVNKLIDASEDGFVKLKDLPAGKYEMVERVAPKKGDDEYRLVLQKLTFYVSEDEELVTIEAPIVKNGGELLSDKKINAKELYRDGETPNRNDANFNSEKVLDNEAMLHHYKNINTPETGTLAQVPFFVGGGVAVSAGVHLGRKNKKNKK